jgi:ParB family chromosome partitioning protein
MALVENIQRSDLDPIEIALSYQRLIDEVQLTQEQMSEKVGKKRSTIANYLRLLKLDPIIQTGIRDGFITMGHGRALITVENHEVQSEMYHKIISQNLTVRDVETLVKNYQEDLIAKPRDKSPKLDLFKIKNDDKQTFENYFGSKVGVSISGNGKGKITIPFESEADFVRIMNLIKG